MNYIHNLKQIADWQIKPKESEVELPTIQRGFVWKTKQIEDLWDSILRGYPIGSFLISKSGNKYYLMDGQQRATSIFLGFFNPYKKVRTAKSWSLEYDQMPTVWIDIKPKETPESSRYLIRVTTNSHPWGYQSRLNDRVLSVSDRKKALALFRQHEDNNKKGYTSFHNSSIFPYDCYYPIPLSFLIESSSPEDVISLVQENIPEYIKTKEGGFNNKNEFIKLLQNELKENLVHILKIVKEINSTEVLSNVIDNKVLNEENTTEDPTLFVRMNSAGTALSNDDLIYSIFKAIFPESKDLIEGIGMNFIPPTQVLSLVSRIVYAELNDRGYIKKMNVASFQRHIKDEEFKEILLTVIENGEIKILFQKAIDILSFNNQMPPVLIKQFINDNQDIFLFFSYWLHVNSSKDLTKEIKLKIVGKLYSFAWFNFNKRNSKWNINRLWTEKVSSSEFWEEPLNELIWNGDNDGIHFLINPNLLKRYYQQPTIEEMYAAEHNHRWGLLEEGVGSEIKKYYENIKGEGFRLDTANEFFWKFIEKIRFNRPLVLFAQRDYINSKFIEYNQMSTMDDTNAPWDWDHIYPSEWVYRKVCDRSIRDWNNTNGNLRVISLEHNRSIGSRQKPSEITDIEERKLSFIQENDWEYWMNIEGRLDDGYIHYHFKAITTRMINIYERFWNDLKIIDLIEILSH